MSATCRFHTADGKRCNASLTLGGVYTLAEATHKIKQWCKEGMAIPDVVGGREAHMKIRPRRLVDLMPEAVLDQYVS